MRYRSVLVFVLLLIAGAGCGGNHRAAQVHTVRPEDSSDAVAEPARSAAKTNDWSKNVKDWYPRSCLTIVTPRLPIVILLRLIEDAQARYYAEDRDGDGVLEFAPSLSELARVGLLPAFLAQAEDTHPNHHPYAGYIFSIKEYGLDASTADWENRSEEENMEHACHYRKNGNLVLGVGIMAWHQEPEENPWARAPWTHCLEVGPIRDDSPLVDNYLRQKLGPKDHASPFLPTASGWLVP